MSELQIWLIALGASFIVLLLGFNWWQDRRIRKRMQAHLPVVDQDPLLADMASADTRREPGLASEPYLSGFGPSLSDSGSATIEEEEPDPSCEVVIELVFANPIAGEQLLSAIHPLRSAGRKPVRVFAQDTEGHCSRRILADAHYTSMQVAVLLANRSGALTDIEWSQVWNKTQSIADQLEATVEGPNQQTVLDLAAKLDDTCAALDTQVGLNLLLPSMRPVGDITAVAKAIGFVPDHGRFVWLGDHGLPCFTLSRADAESFDAGMASVDRLSLLLDVPCCPADDRAFSRMVEVATELAGRLGADLLDDSGRPMQSGSEGVIDERLQALFGQLEAAGLRAGSVRARRVFS